MGPGDGDDLSGSYCSCQCFGAPDDRETQLAGAHQLRMLGAHGGTDHNCPCPIEMTRIVPSEHPPTCPPNICRGRRPALVRVPVASRDRHTAPPGDECESAHPGASNPHEVHGARIVGGEKPHC